jgi:hypothetical protein
MSETLIRKTLLSRRLCRYHSRGLIAGKGLPLLIGILTSIYACSGSTNGSSAASTWDPSAIKPGEKDYPTVNIDPNKLVAFKAEVPSSLRIRFEAYYSASQTAGGSADSGESCQRTVGLAVTAPYFLAVPLELARDGESLSGSVVVDRYQPGRCQWSFLGIRYLIEDGWPPYNSLANYTNHRSDASEYRLDVWCMKDPKASNRSYPEECSRLSMFPAVAARPDIIASIPAGEQGDSVPAAIGPDARSITVRFHDLDAILHAPTTPH